MPLAIQHILVAMTVLAACGFVGWQGYKTFTLRKGKLGACCSKGCDAEPNKPAEAKTQFVPVEMLARRK